MKKQMEILTPDPKVVQNIQNLTSCNPLIARILANRGLLSKKALDEFLNPNLSQIHSFDTLADMDKAVERICRAILNHEKTLVFGDYDVDGITATTLLYEFLKTAGANVDYYIPHRITEGYGLNLCQVQGKIIPEAYDLVITIDCGSASHDPVDCAGRAGIDVIITDHHAISNPFPRAAAVVNPRRGDCASGADYLAGVGVAFCLVISLRKRLREMNFWKQHPEPNLKACCDLVALGTIADVVPLIRENRVMAKAGLELIATAPRPGLAALIHASGANQTTIDAEDIAFKLSPRLNAAGRMDHARLAVKLLTTKDMDQAFLIAAELNKMNAKRQDVEQKIFHQILTFLNDTPEQLNRNTIVLGKKDWHEGVLGIVASKLAEKFFRPVILISFTEGIGKGSGRSIPGIDLHAALCQCAEYLKGFGGHPMAAGLSIEKENFTLFQQAFEEAVATATEDYFPIPQVKIDSRIDFDMISDALVDEISSLAPFGEDNPEPLFCAEHVAVAFSKVMGGKHRRLTLRQPRSGSRKPLNAIWFNVEKDKMDMTHFERLVFKLKWNHWNGKKTIQAIIEHA